MQNEGVDPLSIIEHMLATEREHSFVGKGHPYEKVSRLHTHLTNVPSIVRIDRVSSGHVHRSLGAEAPAGSPPRRP